MKPPILLRNGTTEASPLVSVMTTSLNRLMDNSLIALFELVALCKDPQHQLFGNAAEILKELGLLQADNSVHVSIRNIVLSSVEGNGSDMRLVNPRVEEGGAR